MLLVLICQTTKHDIGKAASFHIVTALVHLAICDGTKKYKLQNYYETTTYTY